ncbi:MAG: AraC family transcriptional regulator [Planctomycetota bacterium]
MPLLVSDLPAHLQSRPKPPPTAMPYRIRTAGHIYQQPLHSTRGTHHHDAMLTLIVAGRGVYHPTRFADPTRPSKPAQPQPLKAGMVGLVLPATHHGPADPGILLADPDDPYEHFYCRFAGDLALHTAARIAKRHPEPFFPRHDAADTLAPLFARLVKLQLKQPGLTQGSNDELDTLTPAEAMLAQLLTILEHNPTDDPPPLTAEALRGYLQDRTASQFDLEHAAEYFNVSASHLCRKAKVLLGRTLQQEAQALKLDWAKVLLTESTMPIAEVARRVGYADPLYFSRVFSRTFHQSPTDHRNQSQHA